MNAKSSAKMNSSGRVVIPVKVRRALGLRSGEELIFDIGDDEFTVTTMRARIARAQKLVRKQIKQGTSLVDELIAERRAAARKELK